MRKETKYKNHIIITQRGPLNEWTVRIVDKNITKILYDDWDDTQARAIRRGKRWVDTHEQIEKGKEHYKRFLK